jgi:hypothetical protein
MQVLPFPHCANLACQGPRVLPGLPGEQTIKIADIFGRRRSHRIQHAQHLTADSSTEQHARERFDLSCPRRWILRRMPSIARSRWYCDRLSHGCCGASCDEQKKRAATPNPVWVINLPFAQPRPTRSAEKIARTDRVRRCKGNLLRAAALRPPHSHHGGRDCRARAAWWVLTPPAGRGYRNTLPARSGTRPGRRS